MYGYGSRCSRAASGRALSIIAAVALPYTPLGALLGLVPLPASLLAALGLVVVCFMLTAEIAKRWFYRNGNGI